MATDATTIIEAINSEPIVTPWLTLIDTREQQPFSFQGLRCHANRSHRPILVRYEWRCLGHFMGDYSIEHYVGAICIERKSVEDLQSTVLGWPSRQQQCDGTTIEVGRRINFEKELDNLNQMQFGAVVVEGTLGEVLATVRQYGKHSRDANREFLDGFIRSYRQTYRRVQWEFCDNRELAERVTFNHLWRFWNKKITTQRRKYARPFRGMTL